jgi:hypothetical protein
MDVAANFLAELESRLNALYQRYAEGLDVSPAERYQLEGFMQAGLVLALCDEATIVRLHRRCLLEILGQQGLSQLIDPLIIPSCMKRAPVFPSTQ